MNDKAGLPLSPDHVRTLNIIEGECRSECPHDRNSLFKLQAIVEYSRDFAGGDLVLVPLSLRFCSKCHRWFTTHEQLADLEQKYRISPRGFDILNSSKHPRPAAYEQWHLIEPAAKPVAPKQAASSKRSIGGRQAVKDMNLAFKYHFCDGGQTNRSYGFRGVCSDTIFALNTKSAEGYCTFQSSKCRNYVGQKTDRENYPCYESIMLKEWFCCAGYDLSGPDEKPRWISGDRTGYHALVTCVLPDEDPGKRRIFAIFLIDRQAAEENGETKVFANPKYRLELMRDEPLYFWNFHRNQNSPDRTLWGTGLYRNIGNEEIVLMLREAIRVIKGAERKALAREMFDQACKRVGAERLKAILA